VLFTSLLRLCRWKYLGRKCKNGLEKRKTRKNTTTGLQRLVGGEKWIVHCDRPDGPLGSHTLKEEALRKESQGKDQAGSQKDRPKGSRESGHIKNFSPLFVKTIPSGSGMREEVGS